MAAIIIFLALKHKALRLHYDTNDGDYYYCQII